MKPTVILLGRKTFSERTFIKAGKIYKVPLLKHSKIIRVDNNREILPTLSQNPGAYSCLAIGTDSGGRIRSNFDSFSAEKPFGLTVIGCLKERIRIGLHIHPDTHPTDLIGVIGHDQAIPACRKSIAGIGVNRTMIVGNNGIGISEVAENPAYKNWAALGPIEKASEKGLHTLKEDFGDNPTFTSFLIIHHGSEVLSTRGERNCCLIFFNLTNQTGELMNFLKIFSEASINLLYIQSYKQETGYRFAMEVDVPRHKLSTFKQISSKIQTSAENVWILGPYECR